MTLGMSIETFTIFHVVLSLVGIGSGLIFAAGLIKNRTSNALTAVFLSTTVITSVTGFMFPFHQVTPGIVVGLISLAVLLPAIAALYAFGLSGIWRPVFVLGSVIALYFNVFVLVVQSFRKVPALNALAPKQTEPAFAIAQLIVLVAFIVIGTMAIKRFRPAEEKINAAASGQ